MVVLGIESSCDETAAAVVDGDYRILSDVVASQVELHGQYGGVVPELASRRHLVTVVPVIEQALREASVSARDLDGVVVTAGPGLVGSLLVGLQVAKSFAYVNRLPLVGENHLAGHLAAIHLHRGPAVDGGAGAGCAGEAGRGLSAHSPEFPFIGMLASGGHTSLYLAKGMGDYVSLGHTRDDAAGEAFDKVAKMLGLGYPGGPIIDELASNGDGDRYRFPRAMSAKGNLEFSFSGVKTSVLNFLGGRSAPDLSREELADVCASVQEAIADVLISKSLEACRQNGVERLVLAGGVAANSRVRELAMERGGDGQVQVFLPPRHLCTDNGAMIAAAGLHRIARGEGRDRAWMALNADPNWQL